ncbi:MAG: hypothetical protein N3B18_01400 [Desulfobacterota bacterium]|nr:hypothetical protein [Thermodesulfobacteriota bacterium]
MASFFLHCAPYSVSGRQPSAESQQPLRIGALIESAYWIARAASKGALDSTSQYLDALIADGRLTVCLGIGTSDLGAIVVSDRPDDARYRCILQLGGRSIAVEGRLVTTHAAFARALSECEIVFVQSHSRFGAGPVFYHDGKARPYRMQDDPQHEVIMPEEEVAGYSGSVRRRYTDPKTQKRYVVFEPDSSDLDATTPLHSYQLLVFSTCTSIKHFRNAVARFRGIYPTTAIFTTRPCCMDTQMEIFVGFLADIFQGKKIDEVVDTMNRTYRTIAERRVRMGIRPWQVVETLFAVGIDTLAVP